MLFDLRGRGRRRTVQVIYIGLALLIGIGLVGFGIGGGFGSGGLLNAANNNEGSGGAGFGGDPAGPNEAKKPMRAAPAARKQAVRRKAFEWHMGLLLWGSVRPIAATTRQTRIPIIHTRTVGVSMNCSTLTWPASRAALLE